MKKGFSFLEILIIAALATISSCKNQISSENGNSLVTNSRPTIIKVTDIDGNVYDTIQIGAQVWMKQNLKTSHYRDGSAIKEIENNITWSNIYHKMSQTSGWCYYNHDLTNNAIYGKLYNWYAVTDPRQLCPTGWHVPSDSEWHTLVLTLDSTATWNKIESTFAGGEMKDVLLWRHPNAGGTNLSGFTALPAGYRDVNGSSCDFGGYGFFWSSTPNNSSLAWERSLNYDYPYCGRFNYNKAYGFSVRCIRDSN